MQRGNGRVIIGVLALQGAFQEHISVLSRLGVEATPVRLPEQLSGIEGLIIPGGESTAIGRLMGEYGFVEPLKGLIQQGLPVLGTCAGMIILAQKVPGLEVPTLEAMKVEVRRNAFGRQVDSFEARLPVPVLGDEPFPCVFIRAPQVEGVENGVEVLARLPGGNAVAVRQGKLLALAFHPELTEDLRFHDFFLRMCRKG